MPELRPGRVALLGSGETSPSGGRVFEAVVNYLSGPPRVAVLETPAGFELNSAQVAGRVADFLRQRLQNHQPEVVVVPARKRHTAFSPDDPALARPMFDANLIFAGPGSPTYAVRQLRDSGVWHTLTARHRLGASEERQAARARRDWTAADALRERIAAIGWSVQDTPDGPRLEPAKP